MLKNIITPRNIKALSFKELSDALSEHCNPAPSVIVERFNFYMYRQEPNQSISDFIARLKKLSQYCEFGDTIEDMLRDITVVGVADDRIRRRLLSEKKLKFQQAREIAFVMESADRNVSDIAAH